MATSCPLVILEPVPACSTTVFSVVGAAVAGIVTLGLVPKAPSTTGSPAAPVPTAVGAALGLPEEAAPQPATRAAARASGRASSIRRTERGPLGGMIRRSA